MSNNASISAAKRRRGGGPPPPSPLTSNPSGQGGGGGGGNLPPGMPPGLPPNFRQLPPQVQQQILRQIQQRGPPTPTVPPPKSTSVHVNKSMPAAPNVMGGGGGSGASNGPYSVNSVLHNRATVEVSGLHIRDLPMTSTGLPCLPSGAPLPPNVLFKLHHDELLNQDATLNEHSNRLQMLMNRVDRMDKEGGGGGGGGVGGDMMMSNTDTAYENIIEDSNFISKVVDNILTNTNLSDIINQIEPLQKENEALRALLNSQQKTLNELSGLVMKLLANRLQDCTSTVIENSEYLTYDANNITTYTDITDVTDVTDMSQVANSNNATDEVVETIDAQDDLDGDDADDADDADGINGQSEIDNGEDGA